MDHCELCEDQGFVLLDGEKVYCSCEIGKEIKKAAPAVFNAGCRDGLFGLEVDVCQ